MVTKVIGSNDQVSRQQQVHRPVSRQQQPVHHLVSRQQQVHRPVSPVSRQQQQVHHHLVSRQQQQVHHLGLGTVVCRESGIVQGRTSSKL
jgi:hypothetical protein